MAKFCTRCGRPLTNGDVCSFCSGDNQSVGETVKSDYTIGFFEAFKNLVGIGNPEINKGDAYEEKKRIVPDCINANEGEIPVKQYELAILQNRLLVFPYAKAVGRLQVTNKRVIFRAPGRSILGRTTLQHEFAIDELAGIEVRRDCYFSVWDLIGGLLIDSLGALCAGIIFALIFTSVNAVAVIFSLIVIVLGCIPMFKVKEHWLLKIFCLGCSRGGCLGIIAISMDQSFMSDGSTVRNLFIILNIVISIVLLVMIIVRGIRPNLVFTIKNKSSHDTVDVRRRSFIKGLLGLIRGTTADHTGFNEVLPGDDADICIKEINAMISDIQKYGDLGIDKWKV